MAGIEVIALVHEPVAAALAYGHGGNKNEVVGVYDFGGGTFDFTVLDMSGDSYRVLAVEGDSWLGGDDFDHAIAEAVANGFWRQTKVELRNRAVEWQRLLLASERAKRQLSEHQGTTISIPSIVTTPKPVDIRQPIDRATLQRLCQDLFNRSLDTCRQALATAGLDPWDLTEVVISGEPPKFPLSARVLKNFSNVPLHRP